MVPEGWKKQPVGELCDSIVPGRNKPKTFDGNIPWVTTPEIKGRYIPSHHQVNYVSEQALKEAGGKLVPAGAVVMAAVGELGLIAITSEPIVLNQQLHAFICSKQIYNEYLAYWLETQKSYMESIASKTTIPYLNKANCESIPVFYPALPEQKKIAQILSTWDKAINITEQLLANSQQQKKALMQQLLIGKKRLLDENGVRFSGEWNNGKLSDIAIIDSGYAFKSNDFTESVCGVPVIRMSDFRSGGIDISGAAKVVVEATGGLDKFKLRAGDFIFGMSGSLSNYGWVKENDIPCYLNQRVGRILAKECSVQLFVSYLFLSDKIQKLIIDKAAGAAQLNISVSDLRATNIQYPSYQEQHRIANVLVTAENHIAAIQQKLEALKQEKKALMQQLLTGKRRVKVDEEAA
ncbi:restriction endonuclease subunit S [Pseudidiomarina aestuarii]|uniref:restriction endonuclease subunit S n=1 Tax=Pseudidiomarina aestuarii TaxID=624146 RepID=UPI003A973050